MIKVKSATLNANFLHVLSCGSGLGLWKLYVINKALELVNNGYYIFYCNSGAFFFRDVRNLIASMNSSDVWLSVRSKIEKQGTKPQVLFWSESRTAQ